jgi:glycosyltransferase involved in cell wall biosynthesis
MEHELCRLGGREFWLYKECCGEGLARAAWKDRKIILSINRFERKKDIGLAIKAYAGLGNTGRNGVRLVLAGLLCLDAPLR